MAGSSSTRVHGVDRFYNPPAMRRQLQQQQEQKQQQTPPVPAPQRPSKTKPRPPPLADTPENRTESNDSLSKPSVSSSSSSVPSLSLPSAMPASSAQNLDMFLDCTTPTVPAQHFPKTRVRGWRSCDGAESSSFFSLGDLWDSFKEWSAYGAGVPLVLNNSDNVIQYYVPYLSGMQLFVDPSRSALRSRRLGNESDGETYQDTSSEASSGSEASHLARERRHSFRDTSPVGQDGIIGNDNEISSQAQLPVFQYLEYDPPYTREPLADKISILASKFPDLKTYKSCDLLPSSWMSVAWYPIYRIPTGPTLKDLDACFLTFHLLSTPLRSRHSSVQTDLSNGHSEINGFCGSKNINSLANRPSKLSLPVFGLATYKFRDSIWASNGLYVQQKASSLLQAAENWMQLLQIFIQTEIDPPRGKFKVPTGLGRLVFKDRAPRVPISSGTRKSTLKFRVLQQHVSQALDNEPQPSPSVFIIQCLYFLPLLGIPYCEGFAHLLISSLSYLRKQSLVTDSSEARRHAARFFLDALSCSVPYEERILLKILEVFDVGLSDIGEALCGSEMNDGDLDIAKAHIVQYVYGFIESESYMTAVTLLERFSIHLSGQSFLAKMVQNNEFKAAEKWAAFMGKPMVCSLIQKYVDLKLINNAYDMIRKHNLKQEFSDVYHLHKERLLKKLAEKGCWDIAEARTNDDRKLQEYLVYLAMEAGYVEKVDELCDRYSLEGPASLEPSSAEHYLDPKLLALEDIIWVDELDGLQSATDYIEGCKVVGLDCEWKPNYEKGSKQNKVSIIQIASTNRAYIFDLIRLYEDEPQVLNSCFSRILCSSNILKLGYSLHCDLHKLSYSYGDLKCFRYFEMFLDIQKLFSERKGGLSALSKKILGAGLNKTRRNSNWEQRPLSHNQLEYAALDAVVLVHIFRRIRDQTFASKGEGCKAEWKSCIVSQT